MRADAYPFGRADGSFHLGRDESAPLPSARPLLAYGANASPAALARKLGPTARVAALAGTLRGWRVVHSRHVSPYGVVPATLAKAPGAVERVHVLLVEDAGVLAALDASEPNYDRVTLRGLDLEAERLGRVAEAGAYLSKHGPLLLRGAPVALGALSQAALLAAIRG